MFEVGPLMVKVNCLRRELPNWQRFRIQSERLIECAREMGRVAEKAD